MTKTQYKSRTIDQAIGHLIEECGEVLAASGKSLRWGLTSTDPESTLPVSERECNAEWLMRELDDLSEAIDVVKNMINDAIKIVPKKIIEH